MQRDSIKIIKELCRERGITISQLEKALGYGNASLTKAATIKSDRLYEIAKYFNVTMEYLMTGIDTKSFYGRVLHLCEEQDMSIEELESALAISSGVSSNWKLNLPSQALLQKIANYFEVSTDYLIYGTWEPSLTAKDEKDIAKRLESTLEDLMTSHEGLMFSGVPLDDETRELLIASLESGMRIAKINAKQKYTPHKYRK